MVRVSVVSSVLIRRNFIVLEFWLFVNGILMCIL